MLEDMINTYGERLVIAVVGVGIAFILLVVVLWVVKRRGGPSPFLKGGKNRQPRLQVLDATAVDARRRLVLVRRDNVEHLIMIGGPTDIVVESGIGAIPFVKDVSERQEQIEFNEPQSAEPTAPKPSAALNVKEAAPTAAAPLQPVTAVTYEPAPVVAKPIVAVKPEPQEALSATTSAAPSVKKPSDEQVTAQSIKAPITEAPTSANAPVPATAMAPAPASAPMPSPSLSSPRTTSAMRPQPTVKPTVPPVSAATIFGASAATTLAASAPLQAAAQPPAPTAQPIYGYDDVEPAKAPASKPAVEDIFDAARERVLPTLSNDSVAKIEPAPDAENDSFSAALRDDFESFLNAEMEKNATSDSTTSAKFAPSVSLSANPAPISGASIDNEAQKEMARIFGEMAVTRDK